MPPAGGLKLQLCAARRGDRRVRFARVSVEAVDHTERLELVTDADGRLCYRLRAGEYRVRCAQSPERRFAVRARGWTPVRLLLR